jgi:subtilisin family serine protease
VGVVSSDLDGSYGAKSGTSMSGPHVAGLVALMISARPELRGQVAEIRRIIESTAAPVESTQSCGDTSPADVPNSVFGFGRIDALAAVLAIPGLNLPETDETSEEPAEASSADRLLSSTRGGSLGLPLVCLLMLLMPGRRRLAGGLITR